MDLVKRWGIGPWSIRLEVGNAAHWVARLIRTDEDVTISVGGPGLSFHLSVDGPGCESDAARSIGVSLMDGHLSWSLWSNPDHWVQGTPAWRDGGCELADCFLGQRSVEYEVLDHKTVWIPMVERAYQAIAVVKDHRTKWPLWPWAKVVRIVNIDMCDGEPIPIPGKGENSYDQGDDAMWGMSVAAPSIEAAIGKVVTSILETRRQRGWLEWEPPKPVETSVPVPMPVEDASGDV